MNLFWKLYLNIKIKIDYIKVKVVTYNDGNVDDLKKNIILQDV